MVARRPLAWQCLAAVVVAAALVLLVGLTWEAGESAHPPPPAAQLRRPRPRGPTWLYPPPAPLLDLPAVSLLANTAICSHLPLLLVILVISHPAHAALRDAHRAHVPAEALDALGARRVFVLGDGSGTGQAEYPRVEVDRVLEEAGQHRDMVVADLQEHYRNLSYKHALALTWPATFCPSATFILKMDDDIMVDVWGVAAFLRVGLTLGPSGALRVGGSGQQLGPGQAWTAGLVQRGLAPQRKGGKWRVTPTEYPGHRYPDFLAGWAYLATRPAAAAILKAAADTPPFWIDDVHMTGTMATAAGVPRYALNHHYSLLSGAAACCLQGGQSRLARLRTSMAPLCGLLVAPSDKNLTVMAAWLEAARACHESGSCPTTSPSACPYTEPERGVGTVIMMN